ncbi:Ubiquitin-associated (UBA)/TS-N domain-containing protein [Heracleum sosnowskyi]|uniref:Ubiquitin-associated (UBA)/TS-N domain-containing protein n=1 Tax=Heracleum sosnowskyi TaxID=360622 RepID=A0AAD8HAX5_9APIA|nr:Ubiquitin-associated (UBA)/TS-N domain-containing protein [Heracleum sosnowskyi]
MATSIVIKVQYGETLRRFSSEVVDGKLHLDMNALREKIHSLYSFPVGSELVLTYIDEDKDVVTLTDEEDLDDIVRQSLNPLRITVKLNMKRSARSQSKSSGNSSPVREPQVQIPLQVKSTSATEVLNSLPDTVRETILNLSTDLGFDTNSPTGYADLLDSLAKMGLSYLKEVSVSGAKSGHLESSIDATVTKDKNSFLAVGTAQVSEKKSCDTEQNNKSGFSENCVMRATDIENVKDKPSTLPPETTSDSFNGTGGHNQNKDNNFCLPDTRGNCNTGSSEGNKFGNNTRSGHKMGAKKSVESRQWWNHVIGPQPSNIARSGHKIEAKKSIEPRQVWDSEPWTGIESSFSNFPSVNKRQHSHRTVPFKRSSNPGDGISSVFHSGVRCNGCGVHPISGTRYKSIMMEDYDLCSICFAGIRNKAEYIRMDRPMSYKDPMQQNFLGRPSALPADLSKLDSCFIQDVNIPDGTIVTPSTRFTKVWRMRNNGSVVWPHGTHLVCIGGNIFSKALSCGIEILADGCPVDKEIDIAVDFTAPVQPGRYVSYWSMSTPSGHKFGQRVWVLIQVNSSLKDPLNENVHGFNLNWPPFSGGFIMDYQDKHVRGNPVYQDGLFDIENNGNDGKAIMERLDNTPKRGQGFSLPTDSSLLVGGAKPNSALLEASLPVKYPAVDLSKVEPVCVPPCSDGGLSNSLVGVGQHKDEVEKTLLQDLEEMGFKQVDLNKKLLRDNDYDLERTLNDLCAWDHIL